MKLNEDTYFPDAKELTKHGFAARMEDFLGKLLGDDPLHADVDDDLKEFGIDAPKALEMLTTPEIADNPDTAVVIRTEKIKNGGIGEDGRPLKDEFQITYKVPKRDPERGIKGVDEKIRNIYIKNFENHIVQGTVLNEDGEGGNGGATNCAGVGGENGYFGFDAPVGLVRKNDKIYKPKAQNEGKKRMKRPIGRITMFITEEQMEQLTEMLKEEAEMDTMFGDFGYEAPGLKLKKDKTLDHSNLVTRKENEAEWHKNLEEEKSGIHIKKKNKGKFTATKKRTGKSTEELTHSKNPLTRKRAIFAQNAKKWNKK